MTFCELKTPVHFQSPRTALTPRVILDVDEHRLVVEGECYPEDPQVFFAPLLEALDRHARVAPRLHATFRLGYVNSAAVMGFRRVFALLDRMAHRGAAVRLVWQYESADEAARETVGDLAQELRALDVEEQLLAS